MCNGRYLDFVIINALPKFDQNPLIDSQDIEHKRKFDINQGHNSVENYLKILCNHPNPHIVNFSAYTKFDRSPHINSQYIEYKHTSDVNQGP